jgi:hypothetical protein
MTEEDEWAQQVWPRQTPAQRAKQDRDAVLKNFTALARASNSGEHDARKSGASTATRKSHGSTSAQTVLKNFIPGTFTGRSQRSPSAELAPHQQQRIHDEAMLEQVRRYDAYTSGKVHRWHWLFDLLPLHTAEPSKPSNEQLLALALRAFPARMDLPVLVCDIRQEDGESWVETVGDIERR